AKNQKQFIDWCSDHGVPESQCTSCDPNRTFSLKSDWCQDHNTRDSVCTLCHPELALKQKNAEASTAKAGQWCEHGFGKKDCFKCNPGTEAKFKKMNDWCGGHDVPESQCFKCQGDLQAIVNKRLQVSTVKTDLLQQKRAIDISLEKDLPAGAFCGTHLLRLKLSSKKMASTIGLRYELVRKRALTETLKCNAEVIYNNDELAKISSRFGGTVKGVSVKLGQVVKKGAVLMVIDSPALGELRSRLKTERDLLALVKTLSKDTQELLKILENKSLNATEASKMVSALKVGEAKAELLKSISEMQSTEKAFTYQKKLKKEGLGLETSFLEAQKNHISAFSGFGALLEKIHLTMHKSLVIQQGKVDMLLGKIGDVKAPKSSTSTGLYVIESPQAGTVISKSIVPGEIIKPGASLATVCNLNKMWVKIDLRQDDVGLIKVGQGIEFTTRGGYAQKFTGKISWLGSEVEDKTRMISAMAVVDSFKELLRKNTYGKVRIYIHRNDDALIIPKTALQWEGCCHVVFVKMADDLFAPRKVKLGYEAKDFYVVQAGLLEGEQLVTRGSFLLKTEILKSSIGAGCTD
ncbi:MAG: efflux RND transporter periplasmic adaptor subunit, partial [Lentisphaeria bacterium]|nr:efflux RND transporter periplasmic adaptor subunit [Lentisphaeria bacterium]